VFTLLGLTQNRSGKAAQQRWGGFAYVLAIKEKDLCNAPSYWALRKSFLLSTDLSEKLMHTSGRAQV
jgi:hypothetical protein